MALLLWSIHDEALSEIGYIIMLLMVVVLVFGAFYTTIRYFKNAPSISVNEESIAFGKAVYYWRELENIEMTGKQPFKFMWEKREGVLLKFKGQAEHYIFDDMYENTPEIKLFIQTIIQGEQISNSLNPHTFDNQSTQGSSYNSSDNKPDVASTEPTKFIYYKGYQLFCLEGIALWLFCGGAFYAALLGIFASDSKQSAWLPIIFILIFLPFFSARMYYFGLSEKYLLVKNHNFLWIKKRHELSHIREIVFEQKGKMPVTLRIICNDFTSKTYPAATLWSKTWMQLKADLEKKGIKVRNECVFYEPFEFKLFNDD
jgi:hypothetical protein